MALAAVSPYLSDRRQTTFLKPAMEWTIRTVLRDQERESLLLAVAISGLRHGVLTRHFARLVAEDLSWVGKEMGTVAQQNTTAGEAMVVAMVIANNYGRSISQDGWGRPQVMRVRLANRRLQHTVRAVA